MKNSIFILVLLSLISCQKEEGEGGTSAIYGKLKTINLQHFDIPGNERIDTLSQYYHADEDVFIIYGDNDNLYDDNYKTTFDGSFGFESLRKGTYTIFVYSECEADTNGLSSISASNPNYANQLSSTIWHPECNSNNYAQKIVVEITENNQLINLEDIIRFNIVSN
jgi:GTPase SAR1 family protein